MLLDSRQREDCTVVTVRDRLDMAGAPALQYVLLKAVADRPRAVVCDLRQARSVDAVALTVLPTVARYAATWNDTPVIVCASHPAVLGQLHRLTIDRWMTVVTTVDLAVANASRVPFAARVCIRLSPAPTAARRARTFVVEACRKWGVPQLASPASLLAGDLVTRAMLDSGGEFELRVTLWDDQLHLSTRHSPPTDQACASASPPPVVRALARSSGLMRTPTGAVVTWCLIGGAHRRARRAGGSALPARQR
jgi:anti-anti-sigma factor